MKSITNIECNSNQTTSYILREQSSHAYLCIMINYSSTLTGQFVIAQHYKARSDKNA